MFLKGLAFDNAYLRFGQNCIIQTQNTPTATRIIKETK